MQSEQHPDQARAALESIIRRQDLMFASISHELRTPLNGIVGLTELVLGSPETSEDSRRRLKVVKYQAMRLNSLVDDILDAASSKRGHLTVKHGRCDLREISESVCTMVQPLVFEKVVLVNNISRGGDSILEGDSNRISQILTNLIGNAIKFTKSGSITIRNRTGRDTVVVEVEDTGIGIADDKLAKIWDAFESVDELADSKYASTGLGLSLVKNLVEAHGGSCWVSSRFGVPTSGTTFSFSLPRCQGSMAQDAARSSLAAAEELEEEEEELELFLPLEEEQCAASMQGLKVLKESSVDAAEARKASLDALGTHTCSEAGPSLECGRSRQMWQLSTNSDDGAQKPAAHAAERAPEQEQQQAAETLRRRVMELEVEQGALQQQLEEANSELRDLRRHSHPATVHTAPASLGPERGWLREGEREGDARTDADASLVYRKLQNGLAARAEREKRQLLSWYQQHLASAKLAAAKHASPGAFSAARTSSSGSSKEGDGRRFVRRSRREAAPVSIYQRQHSL